MKTVRLGELKALNEKYFRIGKSQVVWLINHYDRGSKTYSLSPAEDMNREIFRNPNTLVEIGFEY